MLTRIEGNLSGGAWLQLQAEGEENQRRTHVAAPQELWVLHQSVLRQLLVEELVDVGVQAVTQLQSSCRSTKGHFYHSFFFLQTNNKTFNWF